MGDVAAVQIGVCNVTFDGVDLGFTKGFVKLKYSSESVEVTVDQEDAPIDELITKQSLEVTVPMAESDLERLETLLPGATYVLDSGGVKKKLTLSGESGVSLLDMAEVLVLKPVGGTANDWVTLQYAAPKAEFDFSYEKEGVRVWNVIFKALKGVNGWVVFGDETASQPVHVASITPANGAAAGGTAVIIRGHGFATANDVEINNVNVSNFTVISDREIIAVTPAIVAGTYGVEVTSPAGTDTLASAFTTA